MYTIVAGLMALVAMGASILAHVDPLTTVLRGGLAFLIGLTLASVWGSVMNPKRPEDKPDKKEKPAKEPKKKPAEVESKPDSGSDEPTEEAA
jgi:hypothetical protein